MVWALRRVDLLVGSGVVMWVLFPSPRWTAVGLRGFGLGFRWVGSLSGLGRTRGASGCR